MVRRILFFWLGLAVAGTLTSACGAAATPAFPMAEVHTMPMEVQSAPRLVQEAYQFAAANPDVLRQLPCYCGCGAMGHTSNYACYISGQDAAGAPIYDSHALGCGICVDITQDAMRLMREGQTVPEIKAYVDATYAKYGPSNMP